VRATVVLCIPQTLLRSWSGPPKATIGSGESCGWSDEAERGRKRTIRFALKPGKIGRGRPPVPPEAFDPLLSFLAFGHLPGCCAAKSFTTAQPRRPGPSQGIEIGPQSGLLGVDGSPRGDEKGTRFKAVAAPATVSGESFITMPLGQPGKAMNAEDPRARRPAIKRRRRIHTGRGVLVMAQLLLAGFVC
jgi:hypothetical protein